MLGKTHFANGQPVFRQEGDVLTYVFRTGLKKAEGRSIGGVMQGEWRFWRETGELWQVGQFRDDAKHGAWLRLARDGSVEKRAFFSPSAVEV
ncbi:MAG: toxin-antitoxin system YwqK family antitoxin [Tabrizicola sp.]